MKQPILAGAFATALLMGLATGQVHAACRDTNTCSQNVHQAKSTKPNVAKARSSKPRHAAAKPVRARNAHAPRGAGKTMSAARRGEVVVMIQSMAPSYGVPAWFALRVAKVESNYNPHARGSAGELGVFQLKCATARGIGYRGQCSGLLDARTNVAYGLKHLALAMKSSGGDLRLAASKHNGGLGRKKMVHAYVAKVF